MKKWMLAAAVILVLGYGDLLPFENMDAGQMCIAETLLVESRRGEIVLYAENLRGSGADCVRAAEDMAQNAPGRLFLRQVKRIIFCGDARNQVDILELPAEVPLGAAVYVSDRSPQELLEDMESLEKRLETREQTEKKFITLANVQNGALKEAADENQ